MKLAPRNTIYQASAYHRFHCQQWGKRRCRGQSSMASSRPVPLCLLHRISSSGSPFQSTDTGQRAVPVRSCCSGPLAVLACGSPANVPLPAVPTVPDFPSPLESSPSLSPSLRPKSHSPSSSSIPPHLAIASSQTLAANPLLSGT